MLLISHSKYKVINKRNLEVKMCGELERKVKTYIIIPFPKVDQKSKEEVEKVYVDHIFERFNSIPRGRYRNEEGEIFSDMF